MKQSPFEYVYVSLQICLIFSHFLFRILRIPPFVNHKGKDVNSDWLANQWDERSVLGHAQFHKGRMKGNDPQIDTAQTPKRFDWRLALLGKILKTFTDSADSIPNNFFLLILKIPKTCENEERNFLGFGSLHTIITRYLFMYFVPYGEWNPHK